MTEWELIDATLSVGPARAETLHRRPLARLLARLSRPCISSTASAIPTASSASSRIGRRSAGSALPALPDHAPIIDDVDAEHPFRLVPAPARQFLNTTFTKTPGSQRAKAGRPR